MKELEKALIILNTKYPRPGLKLEGSEPFDTKNPWDYSSWPNNGLPGVYIFANEDNKVQYVGKASATISARLSAYWCKGENGETKSKDWKSEGIRYVYTIGVPNERAFEAPSIEEFLISHLKPVRNTIGK